MGEDNHSPTMKGKNMGIKSSRGMSSVHAPKMSPTAPANTGIKVVSGKKIVHKPINAHHANPGYKKDK